MGSETTRAADPVAEPAPGAAEVAPVELFTEFGFEAVHLLPHVPAGHKCGRPARPLVPGRPPCRGPVDPRSGWLIDFGELKERFRPLHDVLDHSYLNEIEGLENPTSENLARWIWERLKPGVPQLSQVVVQETCTCGVVYRGGTIEPRDH